MSYANLLELFTSADFLAYKTLAILVCSLILVSLVFRSRNRTPSDNAPCVWLEISVALVIISTAILAAVYRLLPVDTAILSWECESVSLYFQGLSLNESPQDFAFKSIVANPGVLSASGNSLMYGIPTYLLLQKLGWSIFTVRVVAYVLGLLALIPGYFLVRRLFNPNVALLFVMLLVTNTHTIFYMGYGVSSTATLFGLLFALALCIAAVQARWAHRYPLALVAGAALFAACFNYSPAKIFVVITLFCLGIYGVRNLLKWHTSGRSGLAAILIFTTTIALFVVERKLNPGADFGSARGEQAFILMQHKDQILNYLGNTSEVQAMDPSTMPLSTKARFLISVVKQRIPEFIRAYNPINGTNSLYPRGSFNAIGMPAYPVGLFPALVLGLIAIMRSPRAPRNGFVIALLVGGFSALFFTTRFDSHRSYLLLIPVLIAMAYGLWLPLRQLRGGFIRESLCALFSLTLATSLIAHSWFFMGYRDSQQLSVREYAREAEKFVKPRTSIAMHLSCETRALVALHLGDIARNDAPSNFTLWDPGLGSHLIDPTFQNSSAVYERFLREAMNGEAVLLYDAPITLLLKDLQTRSFEVKNSSDGSLGVLVVSPKTSSS